MVLLYLVIQARYNVWTFDLEHHHEIESIIEGGLSILASNRDDIHQYINTLDHEDRLDLLTKIKELQIGIKPRDVNAADRQAGLHEFAKLIALKVKPPNKVSSCEKNIENGKILHGNHQK